MRRRALNPSGGQRYRPRPRTGPTQRARDETGQAEWLRKVPPHRGTTDDRHGFRPRTPHGADLQRVSFGDRDAKQRVGLDQPPSGGRVAREVLAKGGLNRWEVWRVSRHRHDRPTHAGVEAVDVDQVEAAHGDPVQEHRTDAVQERGSSEKRKNSIGGVGSVDLHGRPEDPFHIVRGRVDDPDHVGPTLRPSKGPVIEPDNPKVRLGQRTGEDFSPPDT